jgi:protein TonB
VSCIETSRLGRASAVAASLALLGACASRVPLSTPSPEPAAVTTARAMPTPTPAARSWEEYRLQAARRIVAANPQISHTGTVQEPMLEIPVLEVELIGDGSVRAVHVLREPSQAKDTTRIAIEAVRRAGPFGDVSRLPKPWRFSEAFLFNDDRRFKPRSLD